MRTAVALMNVVLRRLHVVVLNSTFVYNNTVCDSVLATAAGAAGPVRAFRRSRDAPAPRLVSGFSAQVGEVSLKGSNTLSFALGGRDAFASGLDALRLSTGAKPPPEGPRGPRAAARLKVGGIDCFVFRKLIGRRGPADPADAAPRAREKPDHPARVHEEEEIVESCRVIHQFGIEGGVHMRSPAAERRPQANRPFRAGAADAPRLGAALMDISAQVSMKSPLVTVTTSAVRTLTDTVVDMTINASFCAFKQHVRPTRRVVDAPHQWWQYVVKEVVLCIRKYRQTSSDAAALPARRAARREYMRLYLARIARVCGPPGPRGLLAAVNPLAWCAAAWRARLRGRLEALEARLSVEEITNFRWWSLATRLHRDLDRRRAGLRRWLRPESPRRRYDDRHAVAKELLIKDRALLKLLTVADDSVFNRGVLGRPPRRGAGTAAPSTRASRWCSRTSA